MSSAATSSHAAELVNKANTNFKIVGVCLAIGSGVFIGSSFVVKKLGLIRATKKYGNVAGEGHGYLKSWLWWTGMIMMIVGEILNFVAYAFTEAILVTPMGSLSVVICAILSHFFLKETLTFFGWIGCTLCILGAIILALNAPEQQSVTTIMGFRALFIAPGFLVWMSLCLVVSGVLIFYAGPRWGRTHMLVYISICSLIGGISVSCTQGIGASIVTSIQGDNQVNNGVFWGIFIFVVVTLLTEINYLNKALELFNTSMVVPVYFCYFSTATLVTSFILYQGLKASAVTLVTMVLGFLVICLGITLLQMSKVDPKALSKLDRRSTMLLEAGRHPTENEEKGEVSAMEDPGMDALRGGFGAVGSIIRARSVSRRLSNASSLGGGTPGSRKWSIGGGGGGGSSSNGGLSTHGLPALQRYQLSDNPMPSDAADKISMYSQTFSPSSSARYPPSPSPLSPPVRPSKSHLKFEEADVVHQYGYGRNDEAMHSTRAHGPGMGPRQFSGNSYPILEEEEGDRRPVVESPTEILRSSPSSSPHGLPEKAADYMDPYEDAPVSAAPQYRRPEPPRMPSRGFSSLFHFGTSPDLTLKPHTEDNMTRGGAHRGTKDYPYRKGSGGDDKAVEVEERRGLVEERASEDLGDARPSIDDSPARPTVVEAARVRRLPDLPR